MREERQLTQIQLAVRLGKPQSYVSKYESGERKLDLPELGAISEALGYSLQSLVQRYNKQVT